MINYSHPLLLNLRRVGQNFGILRPMVRLYRKIFNPSYESSFDQKMMAEVSRNDVVWDIGANIGFFTTKFAEKVGAYGQVYAFEPANSSYLSLIDNCQTYNNVFCRNLALSHKSGYLYFRDSGIKNDPTNCLTDENTPNSTEVEVISGDELVASKSIPLPNIIKIDVEGYELEVIKGMKYLLNIRDGGIKKIFLEIHFLELNKRGLNSAVSEIVKLLEESDFCINWTDPSHLIAHR